MKTLAADNLPKARTVEELRKELRNLRHQAAKDLRDLNSGRPASTGFLARFRAWIRRTQD